MNIKPFKIKISQSQVDDLHERIKRTIWPAVIPGQNYGGPETCGYEGSGTKSASPQLAQKRAELNKLPHFKTEIDGQPIHFIHVKSREANATPLMLIHGWPGSFVEFLHHIEPLNRFQ
jgi:pimeloyl-ACP methyl ester carboxylesterase